MIDIHCHLLPGIDDGAQSWADSVQMAAMAVNDGISEMVLTPHVYDGVYENPLSCYAGKLQVFRELLAKQNIPLRLHLAGEVHLSEKIIDLYAEGDLPFLGSYGDEKIVLLELPHGHIPIGADKLIQWLRSKRIRPIVAHPERNKGFMRTPERLVEFINLGCGFQLTAGSVTGGFGEAAQQLAWHILNNHWCFAVASDAHNLRARPPKLSEAHKMVEQRMGVDVATRLFKSNATNILARNIIHD